jgi:hypothetical protein
MKIIEERRLYLDNALSIPNMSTKLDGTSALEIFALASPTAAVSTA